MNQIANRASALEYLMGRINYERTGGVPYRANRLKLDRMQRFLKLLGDPQLSCPTIHIAGTKGKGSTAAMSAQILTQAGLRTGLYTSPHLERLEERFTIDGRQADEAELVEIVRHLQAVVEQLDEEASEKGESGPTFFEITTALAWVRFARHEVDCAVVEVGLGGRLDSTNVCQPAVTAVTSISLDHTRQLGSDLASIAKEKAGILKAGVPVVIGPMEKAALDVVNAVAKERRCPIWRFGENYSANLADVQAAHCEDSTESTAGLAYYERNSQWGMDGLEVGLLGEHQNANAAIAVCLVRRLAEQTGLAIPDVAVRDGLSATRCAARVELLGRQPFVVLDAAHNTASATALCATLASMPIEGPRALVFSTSRDKDAKGMLDVFATQFDTIILTQFQENPRAASPADLMKAWRPEAGQKSESDSAVDVEVIIEPRPEAAWRRAFRAAPSNGLVCVAGSFFLAAELRPLMSRDVVAHSSSANSL